MQQRHFIGKLNLDFQTHANGRGSELQEALSRLVSDALTPALEQLFDHLAPLDEVWRLDRLEISLPWLDPVVWQADFIPAVCRAVESELERVLRYPLPADADLVQRLSVSESGLQAWLYFLRSGQQPATASPASDWQRAALETVAAEAQAVENLRILLQSNPTALERLVRQHDETFLIHLAEAMSGYTLEKLPTLQRAVFGFFSHPTVLSWLRTTSPVESTAALRVPLTNPQAFAVFFYTTLFKRFSETTQGFEIQHFVDSLIEQIFGLHGKTPAAFIARVVGVVPDGPTTRKQVREDRQTPDKTAGSTEEALLATMLHAFSSLRADTVMLTFFERFARQQRAAILDLQQRLTIKAAYQNPAAEPLGSPGKASEPPASATEAAGSKKSVESFSDSPEAGFKSENAATEAAKIAGQDSTIVGTSLVAANAGVVILHPFLKTYFASIGIWEAAGFTDAEAQRRAVQLIHYLATGAVEMAEYDLALAKILVGLPLDTPIDRVFEASIREQQEAVSLLQTVVQYWSALGNTSPEGLREGFLQRSGRLTRRDDGWLLQPETSGTDILLDRLPWGIGMVKLDWMPEFLQVEWY